MADFSAKPTLTGDRVTLRPMDEGDYDDLKAAYDDAELRRLTGSHLEITEDRAREWMRTCKEQDDRLDLTIVERESGRAVGEAVLNEWDEPNESCSFRILIGPGGRGKGLGTEATRLIVGYGFEQLGHPRPRLAHTLRAFIGQK